jgi:tRNA(Glu) U13 pseudouridine synthase TruD
MLEAETNEMATSTSSNINDNRMKSVQDNNSPIPIWFVLIKYNMEQTDAFHMIADTLSVPVSHINSAGIKDKKAVTFQLASVIIHRPLTHSYSEDVFLEQYRSKLASINQCQPADKNSADLEAPYIRVGNFDLTKRKSINMGELWGNRFQIRLRNTSCTNIDSLGKPHNDESPVYSYNCKLYVEERLQKCQSLGSPNYFGSQRMGVTMYKGYNKHLSMPVSPSIGKLLFEDNYEEAVKLILTDGENNVESNEAMIPLINDHKFNDIMKILPQKYHKQRSLIRGLQRYGADKEGYKRAFMTLPYGTRQLWKHAYQSWL